MTTRYVERLSRNARHEETGLEKLQEQNTYSFKSNQEPSGSTTVITESYAVTRYV